MTERFIQYGKVLFQLGLSKEQMEDMKERFFKTEELAKALSNPTVTQAEKYAVIERLFSKEVQGFLKIVVDHQLIDCMEEILEAYYECDIISKNWVKATFYYVTKPNDEQIERIKERICNEYNKDGVELELIEKPSLIGGFVLKVNDFELDRSIQGSIEQLSRNLIRR